MDQLKLDDLVRRLAQENPLSTLLFTTVGGFVVLRLVLGFARVFIGAFGFGFGSGIKKYYEQGAWAVVTGATDGIGLEFSRQLAKKGFHVLLVSRSQEKLEKVATEIEQSYKVQTKIHTLDFSIPPAQNGKAYTELESIIQTLPLISVLVNNVGRSHTMPVPFTLTTEEELESIIAINVSATVRVTQIVVPKLQSGTRSKKSLILNLGSFAGTIPTPLLAVYSASKAFLVHFTRTLDSELQNPIGAEKENKRVDVRLLNTYYVVSAMSKIRHASWLIPTPATYVRAALGSLTSRAASEIVYAPYWSHALLYGIIESVGATSGVLVGYTRRLNESIRIRALKKIEREKGKAKAE